MMMLFACITVVLLGMLTIALLNTLTFPHLNPAPPHDLQSPLVSILIPARNEAAVIKKTVKNLLSQTYPHFELIILDDNSQDSTATVAQSAGQHDDRLRIIRGQPLPEGWLGKNWACQQLAQAAVGDWLIFTDADVTWQPAALAALMTEIDRTHADVITIWPTQHSQSWSERLVVPLMALAIVGYLPAVLVHRSPWPSFAAANGQCLAFRRSVYESIGGHTRVHSEVLEDVLLARHVKAGGFTLRMVDGNRLVTCRMYRNWTEVREGFAKNILSGYGNSVPLLLLATLFHITIFVLPWLWLVAGGFWQLSYWPVWPLLLVGLGLAVRALTAAVTHQRVVDAALMPLSVLLMTVIAGQAIWWQWRYGGPRWKGRTLTRDAVSARGVHG